MNKKKPESTVEFTIAVSKRTIQTGIKRAIQKIIDEEINLIINEESSEVNRVSIKNEIKLIVGELDITKQVKKKQVKKMIAKLLPRIMRGEVENVMRQKIQGITKKETGTTDES